MHCTCDVATRVLAERPKTAVAPCRREFPDEPGYRDSWAAALELVEACGSNAALQAALLEAPFRSTFDLGDDVMDGVESMLFEDLGNAGVHAEKQEAKPVSACCGIAAKAAELVCLHRGKNASMFVGRA